MDGERSWLDVNIDESERWMSVILGGMLTLAGIQRRGGLGALLALGGIALLRRGATGHCYTYAALGVNTAENRPPLPEERWRDPVDEASEDSFPASDAPSWTVITSVGSPRRRVR